MIYEDDNNDDGHRSQLGHLEQSMFMKLSEYSSRSLRNTSTALRIPSFTTSYGQRSFSYRGVTVWNKLSTEIKNAPSLATFKHLLKQSLKNERGVKVRVQQQTFSFFYGNILYINFRLFL